MQRTHSDSNKTRQGIPLSIGGTKVSLCQVHTKNKSAKEAKMRSGRRRGCNRLRTLRWWRLWSCSLKIIKSSKKWATLIREIKIDEYSHMILVLPHQMYQHQHSRNVVGLFLLDPNLSTNLLKRSLQITKLR